MKAALFFLLFGGGGGGYGMKLKVKNEKRAYLLLQKKAQNIF